MGGTDTFVTPGEGGEDHPGLGWCEARGSTPPEKKKKKVHVCSRRSGTSYREAAPFCVLTYIIRALNLVEIN